MGDKYIKIDPSTNLYDTINIPYSGDENIFNTSQIKNKFKANIFKRLVSKKKKKNSNRTLRFRYGLYYRACNRYGLPFDRM